MYWFQQSLTSEFCYAEDLGAGDYQRYLSETPTPSLKAYERYATTVNADSFNNLAVGDRLVFRGDDTVYKVTSISGEIISLLPPLRRSVRIGDKFAKAPDIDININYSNCFNIKLKYPNIFLTDTTNKKIYKYYNNGVATLGIHPMSYYTSDLLFTCSYDVYGVTFAKCIPVADGYLNMQNGDMLYYAENDATYGGIMTCKTRKDFSQNGNYALIGGVAAATIAKGFRGLVHGYIEGTNSDDNSIRVYNVCLYSIDSGAITTQTGRLTVDMQSYGDEATLNLPTNLRRKYGNRRDATNPNLPPRFRNSSYSASRFGPSSVSGNGNEFGYYKLQQNEQNILTTETGGLIGTSNTVYSMSLNSDVLNPNYDDLVYADCNHANCISKFIPFSPTTKSAVFTGTPPTAGTIYNFIVNHGEGANQEYYYYDSVTGDIIKNAGTAWTDSAMIINQDAAKSLSKWGTNSTLDYFTSGEVLIRKAYDNFLIFADTAGFSLFISDIDNSRVHCIEDTTILDSIGGIDIQCFTNWYEYQGATNSNIFENDVCFNASKLAYKFYSKNRRVLECNVRDADMGYIDYTLFDRFTVDSSILSAASGSPKFYVYAYDFNWETHDQKLTLLESVE